jgi:tRNA(adenine34) deaminase
MFEKHRKFMQLALQNAELAAINGDIPVAALIVKDNIVISSAYNQVEITKDPTAHAEIIAINKAVKILGEKFLYNCSLYVTLEPCYMCSGAIVLARIPELIFGASDSKTGSAGSIYNIVHDKRLNHQCNVIGGVMESECSEIIKRYFAELREK